MIHFNCDYSEGAHPRVLEKLTQTNLEQTCGYGADPYCRHGAELLKNCFHVPQAEVHFLCGGTQTNLTVIKACLRPYQCVISADSGHINVHEAGAIEATGNHITALPAQNGKITADQIAQVCRAHWQEDNPEFAPQPKLVYLSFPTEYGTIYSKEELTAIRRVCDENNLFLLVDGARLGYGLEAAGNDLTPAELAALCDVFYVGGTKNGALLGEAVIIVNPKLQKDFRYFMKQRGGILAKGRVLGIQFEALFENNLYFDLARRANELATQIAQACKEAGLKIWINSPTNQQFIVFPNEMLRELETVYKFAHIRYLSKTETLIRICTGWATRAEDVAQLCADLKKYAAK